jgi:hypothetical protein
MNRKNFIVNLGIAIVLIAVAAMAGQMLRWQKGDGSADKGAVKKATPKPNAVSRSAEDKVPEVLVKFRHGVSLDEIKKIAGRYGRAERPIGRRAIRQNVRSG